MHATGSRSHATPLSFDASLIENPCENPHKLYIAKHCVGASKETSETVVHAYVIGDMR